MKYFPKLLQERKIHTAKKAVILHPKMMKISGAAPRMKIVTTTAVILTMMITAVIFLPLHSPRMTRFPSLLREM